MACGSRCSRLAGHSHPNDLRGLTQALRRRLLSALARLHAADLPRALCLSVTWMCIVSVLYVRVCVPDRQALVTRLGSIFAPGIASILHSNYTISMDFLRSVPVIPVMCIAIDKT